MRPTKHFNAGISLFVAMALCGTAVAEIEEITVTAQKREENVQDVPISVSTFSDDFFTRSNVNTLRDMARYAPNLTLPQSSTIANQRIIMRGVGSVGNSAIEPTVAVFIDGVYYPRPSSIVGSMTDLERAEVLRGPQGTLFGRNASMGALNIVTKNPTDEHEGRISFGYGDYDEKRVSGYVNSAISEMVSARLSFQVSGRDGYGENTYTEGGSRSTVGDWEDMTVRGKLLLSPSPTTDVLLTGDYSRVRNEGAVTEFIGDTAPGQTLYRLTHILPPGELPEAGDVYDHRLNQMHRDDADDEQWGLSGDITWTVGEHTIRSITAYRDWENDSLDQSVIRLPADLVPTDQFYDAETFSQELQITSPDDENVEYVFGLYYYDEEYSLDSNSRLGKDFCGMVERLFAGQLTAGNFMGARGQYFAEAYRVAVNRTFDGVTAGAIGTAVDAAVAQLPPGTPPQIAMATAAQLRAGLEAGVEALDKPALVFQLMAGGTQVDATDATLKPRVIGGLKQTLTAQLQPAFAALGAGAEQVAAGVVNTLVDGHVPINPVTMMPILERVVPSVTQLRAQTQGLSQQNDPATLAQLQGIAGLAGQGAAGQCIAGGTDMAVTDFDQDVKNYAAYGHVTFHMTPQWRLATGVRYTKSEKDGKFTSVVNNPLIEPPSQQNPFGLDLRQNESHPSLSHDEEKVTWLANLSHFLDDDTMVFANFSTGFKSGGFNPEGFNSQVAEAGRTRKFDTETTKNYELGIKSTLMEGQLVANATLYRTKVNDFQERQFDGLNLIVHNSGDLTQQGVELDMQFQPREELYATLGVSYLDSEFDSFPNATAYPGHIAAVSQVNQARLLCLSEAALGIRTVGSCPAEPLPIPTRDMKGERNHFSPKWQVAMSAEWIDSLPNSAADWFVRGEYQYMDDQNVGADTNQNPDTMQSNYNLFNGGAGVRGQNGDWEVSLFVKNIFDEEYCQTKYSQPLVGSLGLTDTMTGQGAQRCSLGEPRTWSLVGSFLF